MESFSKHQYIKAISCGDIPDRNEMIKKDVALITGRQLKKLRLEHGLTGFQFGKILGISQQQVSRYEHGVTALSIETVVTLCIYFNVSFEHFLAPLISTTEDNLFFVLK